MGHEKRCYRLHVSGPIPSKIIDIKPGRLTIGSEAGNKIHLVDPAVSKRHARITCSQAGCEITDLHSDFGTTVNGRRLLPDHPQPLFSADVIKIGPFSLVFEEVGSPEEALQTEQQTDGDGRALPLSRSRKAKTGSLAPRYIRPPGLSDQSCYFIHYLPPIYQDEFMARFLAIFETIFMPIMWQIDNFDLFLSPLTAPPTFVPWLASWLGMPWDERLPEASRKRLLSKMIELYQWRGTKRGLQRYLQLCFGLAESEVEDRIEIFEKPIGSFIAGEDAELGDRLVVGDPNEDTNRFTVTLRLASEHAQFGEGLIREIIDQWKPAHTTYDLRVYRALDEPVE